MRTTKTHLIVLLCCLLVTAVSPLAWGDVKEDTRPRNVRVVWLRNPSTTATLIWDTIKPTADNSVRIQQHGAEEARTYKARWNESYSYADKENVDLIYHRVLIDGLLPSTRYDVEFESDGQKSRRMYFVSAPDDNRSMTLLFGGDSRSDQQARRAMNEMMAELVTDAQATEDPSDDVVGLIHAGDYVATGTSLKEWSRWLGDHELTTAEDGRLLPIIPARGNHDRGRLFNEAFGFKIKDQHNWYGVSFGTFLRVSVLNTEASVAGRQAKWLDEELATNRATHRWLVAQYHRPAYAATKWPSSALIHWVPLFEKYNVDLVCEGDGHTIKRTVPIRNGKQDPTGIVYVGEGGLGVPPRMPKPKRWYLQSPGMCGAGHHVQRLRFDADKLTYEVVLLGGKIGDRWEKEK